MIRCMGLTAVALVALVPAAARADIYVTPAPAVSYYGAPAPVVSYYSAPAVSYYSAAWLPWFPTTRRRRFRITRLPSLTTPPT